MFFYMYYVFSLLDFNYTAQFYEYGVDIPLKMFTKYILESSMVQTDFLLIVWLLILWISLFEIFIQIFKKTLLLKF